jgi:hypothetical protein
MDTLTWHTNHFLAQLRQCTAGPPGNYIDWMKPAEQHSRIISTGQIEPACEF